MGCWNISFWDNDECVGFLLLLFPHLALMPFPTHIQVGVMVNKVNSVKLLVRHNQEEYDEVHHLLVSITAKTLETAKQVDPYFKEKLFRDAIPNEQGLERIGLTKQHLWTLIHMHVGAPIDDMNDLDTLAKAFDSRDKGGTWIIDPFLQSLTGATLQELEELRNEHAPMIRQGILQYKYRIKESKPLKPMKLAYLGPVVSQALWFQGMLPASLPADKVWDTEYVETLVEFPKPDCMIDERKCSSCKTLQASRDTPLMACPCKCVFYCNKTCQVCHVYEPPFCMISCYVMS